ncbi:MAG: MG2 domain-containing protein, partial [Kofleriaceae bacterium]
MNLRRVLARSLRLTSPCALAGLALLLSCGGPRPAGNRELQVLAFSPEGTIDKAEQITIRFDKPVVAESAVGKPADPATVAVSPAFTWSGFWQDTRTLVVDPTERLAASTKYTVTLQGDLATRTQAFAMSFVHRPLAIEGVSGIAAEMIPADAALPIAFNQPVIATEVAGHCKLVHDGTAIALTGMPGVIGTTVAMKPASRLISGEAYTLACEGLTGAGGNLAMAAPYELELTVRPAFAVTTIEPGTTDVAADEVNLVVTFTTPVSLDAARKAVTSTPAIPGLEQGYLSGDSLEYHVTTDLDTRTKYTLKVAAMTDTFGQALDKPTEQTFTTGDARPRISMERGIFAVEASAKGYPVWSRNIGKYDVECGAIPKAKLVQVLTTDMNYDAWGGNNDDKPVDWKAIGLAPKTTPFKPTVRNTWKLDEVDLGKVCGRTAGARGVYLAEVRSDEVIPDPNRGWLSPRRNRVLANVTDLGVTVKTGTASGIVWVTSLASGQPVGGASVSVYTPQGKLVHTGTTSSDGLVKVPGSALMKAQKPAPDEGEGEDWDSFRTQRMIAIVENGADLAVVDGNWSNGIQLWNFGVTEDRRGGAVKVRGFIQSDRGLYRPGEQVHFKGIAREIAQGKAPRVPTTKPVEIEVQDSRGQSVLTTKAQLSAFGGFAFDMGLGEDAAVGDYYVRAKVGEQVFREKFSVEEFRPATFEVKLGAAAGSTPKPGEQIAFELDAKYLMGSAAAGANVEWNLRKRDHVLRFPGFDMFTFSANPRQWWWYEPSNDYGDFIGDGTGKTDAQGKLRIEARDTATTFEGPVDYILAANVTDSADQTMGKSSIVTAHKTDFYLGMHANEFVQAVGMPFGVNLVALKPDGARTGTKAKLSVIRTVNSCSWYEMGSRSFQRCDPSPKTILERDIDIANAGSHTERIVPTEPGDYTIKAVAKDAHGNDVVVASQIWVIGKGEAFWSGDEGARMTLVASKPSYAAGDTARLVAQANLVKPTALITIERDGVIEARVKQLASPSEGIEIPINDAWAPNVYAGVTLVSGRHGAGDRNRPQFKMGIVELKVASTHKQLDVGVALDQATVRPGDKVSGKIKVSHAGKPVKAEVSLSAADEGILQLISYATPNPMKTFYASYGLGVDPATNWNRIARLADPSKGDPDEGGDSGSTLGNQRVRSKFVASAYWAPMLVTDDRGEIAFTFTAPDNLTAFRLMAVAADLGDRFGSGELRLTVNKPVMAAPALPRFLRSGDAASVGIVIHNNTDTTGTAIVTAKANGAVLDAAQQAVSVPANGSVRVRFAAKASDNAAATFEFGMQLGKERDSVRVTVPIDRPRVYDNRLLVESRLGKGGTWTGTLGAGKDILRDESTLAITVDRSGVGDLAPGLHSLIEYPYGCLEQTMSRFIPLVAAKDLAKTLDDPSLQGTKAEQFIHAGVAKVIRHQQGDGLFSLWPQS